MEVFFTYRAPGSTAGELKEETGYVGTVVAGSAATPALPLSPGLSNETVQLVRVDVDLDAPENANPKQELEGSEFITVLRRGRISLHTCSTSTAPTMPLCVAVHVYASLVSSHVDTHSVDPAKQLTALPGFNQ